MASLSIRKLHKHFGSTHVLKGIDIEVQDGEFLILVGPSGCGKSTLLSMIAGLDDISEGEIFIGDKKVNEVSPSQRDIAMVFQSYALYPSMTVRENIEFGMKMKKVPASERAEIVARVSKTLQIDALLERRPAQLSGGQRQRVAMGRALARNPAVFLFDEPLSNLDAKLRVEMRAEIKSLHQRMGTTIVYVTHDQVEAMTLGDKIAVMKEGLVQQFGSPEEIYERPANMYVAGFIGSPTMNFLPAVVQRSDASGSSLAIEGCDQTLSIPSVSNAAKNIVLGIRPEHFQHVPAGTAHAISAQVEMLEPTGADTFGLVSIGSSQSKAKANVRFAPKAAPKIGEQIWLSVDTAAISLFDAQSQERISTSFTQK